MLFNCRIVVLFAVSCAALDSLRPHPYSTQTDLASRLDSDTTSLMYRSEQQLVSRTNPSTPPESPASPGSPGSLFSPWKYGDNDMFSDWGNDSGENDSGHNAISRPKPLDSDPDSDPDAAFYRLHNSHRAPIADAPTPSTIDPKKLVLLSPADIETLLKGYEEECDEMQIDMVHDKKKAPWRRLQDCIRQKAAEAGINYVPKSEPDKLSELEIKALLERYENQCEAKKKALAKRHKWSLWMALQRCIRHKANVRYIPYDMKPDPGGTKTRLTSKRLSNLPLLPEDHESEYRKGCEEWCKTQKKKRDECIEDCIRRREGDRGFHYKPKVNPERAEADDAS